MFGKLKLSTYSSLLTGKRTILVASYGKCGHGDYREAQIKVQGKHFMYTITDGYSILTTGASSRGIKSVLNIVEGKMLHNT